VPAAAVIPAPIAYIKVVAVKKLVVGFWNQSYRSTSCCTDGSVLLSGETLLNVKLVLEHLVLLL
jgi:hypothetical protein